MVEVKYSGGLGERLFQYCFGRLLAERFGYALEANPIPAFPGTRTPVNGNRVVSPMTVWSGNSVRDSLTELTLTGQALFDPPEARIVLHGHFQRYEYFRGHAAEIRDRWLALDPRPAARPADELVICHGRDHALRAGEIRGLVDRVAPAKLFIATETPDDPLFFGQLADLNPTIIHEGPMANFRFIASFGKIALCQDATSWWAAFLSEAQEIYFPPCDRGPWSGTRGSDLPDLRVPEPRYVYDWCPDTSCRS